MKIYFKYCIAVCLSLLSIGAFAQTPQWGFNLGGSGTDGGYVTKTGPNGNVCVGGRFSGTIDLDPGSGVYNITSAGNEDMFLACYSPSGTFLWGFGIGGGGYDFIYTMAIDASNNVIIGGDINSAGIDFDPGSGTAIIGYTGGSTSTWGGDGFVAKFSSTGVYQWAHNLGGETEYDGTHDIDIDAAQNVYVCGEYTGTMPVSSSLTMNSSATGKCYIVKYNPSGTVIWGISFGLPGYAADDTQPWSMKVSGRYIYISGTLQGTSYFNPATGGATLTSSGYYDAWFGKYDTAGNYVFANAISGPGYVEEALYLSLDPSDNIYMTGYTSSSSLTFDAAAASSSTVSTPGGGGSNDIWIAKYNSSGVYQWGKVMGGSGNEIGRGCTVSKGNVYYTGQFENTVDFDPSGSVANLTSNGGGDIYVAKFDLGGNYNCAFNVGGTGDDYGYSVYPDTAGHICAAGEFTGTATDFDPATASSFPLTSIGGIDAYLVNYKWLSDSTYTGFVTGDTICQGDQAYMTLNLTAGGTGPYTVNLTDGSSSYTYSGIVPGTPFMISPTPSVTTVYTVTSVVLATVSLCSPVVSTITGAVTIVVHPSATVITDSTFCNAVKLSATAGSGSYTWTFGDGDGGSANPVTHMYTAAGTYSVIVQYADTSGCIAKDTAVVTVNVPPLVNLGPDTVICGGAYTMQSSYAYAATATFLWSTGETTPSITVNTSGTYKLTVYLNGCEASDIVKVTLVDFSSIYLGADTTVCMNKMLSVPISGPGITYLWQDGSTESSYSVSRTGRYYVTVNNKGCKVSDTINVTFLHLIHNIPDTFICKGTPIDLNLVATAPAGGSVLWENGSTSPDRVVRDSGTYWVYIKQFECEILDTIRVTTGHCDCWHNVPTAFTPNDDGLNDIISPRIQPGCNVSGYLFSIYNRWGEVVFSSDVPGKGWDGTYKGVPCDMGVYYYMLQLFVGVHDKKKSHSGDITLIR